MTQDEDQLRLISIFHYVVAGVTGLCSLFPILHLIVGILFILAPDKVAGNHGEPPPAFIGWFFVIFAATLITFGLVLAGFILTAGRFLARRKHYTFCLVVAGVECLFFPFGTVLGVFSLIVLMREPVKQMFSPTDELDALQGE